MPTNRLVVFCALAFTIATSTNSALAQESQINQPQIPHWAAIVHELALKSPHHDDTGGPTGVFPPIIPRYLPSIDPSGAVATFNTDGPTLSSRNAFFQSLGSNGRACASCHEPRSGWGVSAASIQQRFDTSAGTDPIFRPVDGATCDSDDVGSISARRTAYSLLLSQGLIRIFLPLPPTQLGTNPPIARDFNIVSVSDPYGCTDLSANPPIISVYRRPLPSANLRFLTECPQDSPGCSPLSIMWDGREPSLASQVVDATLGHAQATSAPSSDQVTQIVNFESALYDAQAFDNSAGILAGGGGTGGPVTLSQQPFFIGINDSLSAGFNDLVFTLYNGWANPSGFLSRNQRAARQSIARGETIFNSRQFTVTEVAGLNLFSTDPLGANVLSTATCTTCHDTLNVGNHSKVLALDIGVADANPPVLDVTQLPMFTVQCTETTGPLAGRTIQVTDLGRALISGKCVDVGKTKGPILRGLAARAPYFHNGSAASLDDVVNFYDQRFSIGLSDQDKSDLVAFLKAL